MRRLIALVIVTAAITLGLTGIIGPAGADSAPVNGRIAFTEFALDFESFSGFTIDANGAEKQRVGPKGAIECTRWSPDGNKILCNDWATRVQPATADPDGSNFTLLNPDIPFDLFCTFWSPTGSRILCHSEGKPNREDAGLYTARSSDAEDLQRLTVSPRGASDVPNGYSPDGSRILFSRFHSEGKPGVLFSVTPDGNGKIRLTPPGLGVLDFFAIQLGASWSPDGSRVAFAGQVRSTGKQSVYVVNADGTGLRKITPQGIDALTAQWSPGGGLIAFTGCCTGVTGFQVWVIGSDGTGLAKVVPSGKFSFSRNPVWSPDGRTLLFVRNVSGERGLWTASPDGSDLAKVTATNALIEYSWGVAPTD